jgi:hypothetical protein
VVHRFKTMTNFPESSVENAALAWLESLGYAVIHGPEIAAGMPRTERSDPSYRDVVLEGRLRHFGFFSIHCSRSRDWQGPGNYNVQYHVLGIGWPKRSAHQRLLKPLPQNLFLQSYITN